MLKRSWGNCLLVLSFIFSVALLQANDTAQPQENPLFKAMQALQGEDFPALLEKILQGQYQKERAAAAAKRERCLSVLSEELRTEIVACVSVYKEFAESLKFDACCIRLCKKVYDGIQGMSSCTVLSTQLEKLHKALQVGILTEVLASGRQSVSPTDIMGMMQALLGGEKRAVPEDVTFTLQDVRDTDLLLQAFVQCEASSVPEAAKQLLNIIQLIDQKMTAEQNIIQAMKDRDAEAVAKASADEQRAIRALASACFASREPDCQALINDFRRVRGTLADALIHISKDEAPVLYEAHDFWIKQLRKYSNTLQTFLSVYERADIDLSLVMKTMSQTYDIARIFFEFNRFDAGTGSWVSAFFTQANLWDQVIKSSIVSAGFMHRYTEASSGELQKIIFGNGSVAEYADPLDKIEQKLMLGVQSLFLFMNPTAFGTVQPIKRAMFRIMLGLLPYCMENGRAALNSWPNQDEWLRIAVFATLKELQFFSSEHLKTVVTRGVDPVLVEKIDTFSMGLIKPELVDLCFDILFPVFLMQRDATFILPNPEKLNPPPLRLYGNENVKTPDFIKSVIDFKAGDALKYEYGFQIHMAQQYRAGAQRAIAPSFDVCLHNNIGYFIEYRILQYVLKNLGFFWGSYLTKACKGPIHATFRAVGNGIWKMLALCGVVDGSEDEEYATMRQEEIDHLSGGDRSVAGFAALPGMVQENVHYAVKNTLHGELEMIKQLVISLFHDQSYERLMVVGFLKNNQLLAEDVHDAKDVNYAIITLVMSYLIKFHLMSHLQAATLLNTYLEHQDNVTPFIDELFVAVQDNVAGAVGGMLVGFGMGSFAAPAIMENYGPFILKN